MRLTSIAAAFILLCIPYQAFSQGDLDKVLSDDERGLALKEALSDFRYSYDPFEKGISFFMEPTGESSLGMLGFIGEDSSDDEVAFSANYQGEDWIYAEDLKVLIDGDVWEKDGVAFQRDVLSGSSVLEMGIIPFDQEIENLIDRMNAAEEVMVRMSGRGHHDFTANKDAISSMHNLKDALKL